MGLIVSRHYNVTANFRQLHVSKGIFTEYEGKVTLDVSVFLVAFNAVANRSTSWYRLIYVHEETCKVHSKYNSIF